MGSILGYYRGLGLLLWDLCYGSLVLLGFRVWGLGFRVPFKGALGVSGSLKGAFKGTTGV